MYQTLKPTPSLAYTPRLPTEAESDILTMLRPYLSDPDTLFVVLDALLTYYRDELDC